MEWYGRTVLAGAGIALFGKRLFRLAFGYRCLLCKNARLRLHGRINEIFVGMRSHWACNGCGSRFVQLGWGKLDNVLTEPGTERR
jgi:transposase-like protein